MIKILKANEVEPSWFKGRNFTDANEVVQQVITDVINDGDKALKKYGEKFDVSSPSSLL